jgi:hypothetical protein
MKRIVILALVLAGLIAAAGGAYFMWSRTSAPADRVRPQTPTAPLPYQVTDVSIVSPVDGVTLAGTLSLPSDGAPSAAIVLLGVAGPNDRDLSFAGHRAFAVVADRLTRSGVAVLRLDDRGVGASGGDWKTASYDTLAVDALAALHFLSARPEVDASRLGVMGLSEGASIAAMAASTEGSPARFVVMASPPGLDGGAAIRDQFERLLAMSGVSGARAERYRERFERFVALSRAAASDPAELAELESFLAGPGRELVPAYGFVPRDAASQARLFAGPWYQSQLDLRPADFYARLDMPALVIGGGVDQVLPPSAHHPVIRAAMPHAEFMMFEGVSHLLQPAETGLPNEYARTDVTVDPRILDALEQWVLARAAAPASAEGVPVVAADSE